MDRYSFASRASAGAMELGSDPVPPVPPELDLDLDLDIDFDSLPELDLPDEVPAARPKEAPKAEPPRERASRSRAPVAMEEAPAPRSRAWWPLLGGLLTLLVIALVSVPFALVRLGDMSRDMTRLSERVEAAETENDHLHDKLAREAADAVAERLVETDRRIDRVRCALDDVRRTQAPPQEAARPGPPAVAKAPDPPRPAPVVEEPPKPPVPGPLVGASKARTEPIEPASAVRTKGTEAPPIPPKPSAKKPDGDGRIMLPTELYNEDE